MLRLPIGTIQRYLRTVHELHVSMGAIVDAVHRTARKAQGVVAGILERIRGSPVVHADETGWRQNGNNGYVWTFSTPTERYFLRRDRGKTVVDVALSNSCSGVLVSDSYAAYHHYDGPQQRCWVHPCSSQGQALLRDSHDLCALYPDDAPLARWADAVHRLYTRAKAFTHPQARRRHRPTGFGETATAGPLPALTWTDHVGGSVPSLCRRIQRHIKSLPRTGCGELFVFVAEPESRRTTTLPSAACVILVISRKVSGGTRSEAGADSKMILASLFGTWRTQGFNPLVACRQLLTSPQP